MSDSKMPQQTDKKKAKTGGSRAGKFFSGLGKRLTSFFVSMKAEIKRIMWPDRKRLIQSTTTVLVIVVLSAVILFAVDSLLGSVLEAVGFYTPNTAIFETTAETAAAIEATVETTVAETAAAA